MEFADILRGRHMARNFERRAVDVGVLDGILHAATRAPSAGNVQAVDLIVLAGADQTALYWDTTTTQEWRASTRRAGMLRAPVVVLPVVRPDAYPERYGEADKMGSGLDTLDAWPVPYWWTDAAFAALLLMLAAADEGLGAAFLGMFRSEDGLLEALGVPADRRCVGAVLIGHPALPDPPSSSALRARRHVEDIVHRGRW